MTVEVCQISVDDYSSDSSISDDDFYNIDGFEFVKMLGRGATGVVLEMQKDGHHYAAKVCNTRKQKLAFLSRQTTDASAEAAILLKLNNKNIVKVFKLIDDADNNRVFMIMELLDGGTLDHCTDKRVAFGQVLRGVQYIHAQRLAHRDIKMANVMLDSQGNAKLCDFGLAVFIPPDVDKIASESVGTLSYMAPETIDGKEYDPFKADIWALGVLLFELMFETLPFQAKAVHQFMSLVASKEPEYPASADPDLVALLRRLLEKDPAKRPSVGELWDMAWLSPVRPNTLKLLRKTQSFFHKISLDEMREAVERVARGRRRSRRESNTTTTAVGKAINSAMMAVARGSKK